MSEVHTGLGPGVEAGIGVGVAIAVLALGFITYKVIRNRQQDQRYVQDAHTYGEGTVSVQQLREEARKQDRGHEGVLHMNRWHDPLGRR